MKNVNVVSVLVFEIQPLKKRLRIVFVQYLFLYDEAMNLLISGELDLSLQATGTLRTVLFCSVLLRLAHAL